MKYGREMLQNVEGYVPGEQPAISNLTKLNTNENPYPPSPAVLQALRDLGPDALTRYPDPLSVSLRKTCATQYGYQDESWVVIGNGMDELLAMALRTFVDPGDRALTTFPTYTLYETLCELHGVECLKVDLDDQFQLTDEFYATKARLCFLPRPNAPSGVAIPRQAVEKLCRQFDGIVIIDEAYTDFADDNCMDFPKKFDNAIVMRTFSKSFSLAGMRLGVAVANPELIAEFLKTKDSYNMNAIAQAVGSAAMQDYGHMLKNVEKVKATREALVRDLSDMGFHIPPSQANFILAQWDGKPSASEIMKLLREQGIIVRYFDTPRLSNALRITIGTDNQMKKLTQALTQIIE